MFDEDGSRLTNSRVSGSNAGQVLRQLDIEVVRGIKINIKYTRRAGDGSEFATLTGCVGLSYVSLCSVRVNSWKRCGDEGSRCDLSGVSSLRCSRSSGGSSERRGSNVRD